MLPSAGILDGRAPPDSGRSVEVEEAAAAIARGVLDDEMAVEEDRLRLGQVRRVAVQVLPPDLHHPDPRIREEVDAPQEEIRPGDEVGVEHRHEFAVRDAQTFLQRSRLEAVAVFASQIGDVVPGGAGTLHGLQSDPLRFVRGIVQHLDLQAIARILDAAYRFDEPFDDVHLVENRELDGDPRVRCKTAERRGQVSLVLVVQVRHHVAVGAVERQHEEDEEIRPEEQPLHWRHRARAPQYGENIT